MELKSFQFGLQVKDGRINLALFNYFNPLTQFFYPASLHREEVFRLDVRSVLVKNQFLSPRMWIPIREDCRKKSGSSSSNAN